MSIDFDTLNRFVAYITDENAKRRAWANNYNHTHLDNPNMVAFELSYDVKELMIWLSQQGATDSKTKKRTLKNAKN